MLIGTPDSGKTNYLARLWKALGSPHGRLRATAVPESISYVDGALEHLLTGEFAPRSEATLLDGTGTCSLPISWPSGDSLVPGEIVVPDISGELWLTAVRLSQLPTIWMDKVRNSPGALLFVRIGSDQNIEPLDWVTARDILAQDTLSATETDDESSDIATTVQLCELIRFLELELGTHTNLPRPRVAILVTAWDILDTEQRQYSPTQYLAREYPLVSRRIADLTRLDVNVFGISVVGGDFQDATFRQQFLAGNIDDFGYVMIDTVGGQPEQTHDLTVPLAWVLKPLPAE